MLFKQRHRIVPRLACVNHDWLAVRCRDAHLLDENILLSFARREVVVIIETDFAHSYHLGMRKELRHANQRFFCRLRRIVRMYPDRRVEGRVPFRHANSRFEVGRTFTRADRHHLSHARLQRALDYLVAIRIKVGAVEMAVRIDQHYFKRAPTGTSSRKPARTGLPPSSEAATIMPCDSRPRSFRGARLATITTFRPSIFSGSYASAIPATIVRGAGSPMSTFKCSNLSDPFTRSADNTRPTRRSTFPNSSMLMVADAGLASSATGFLPMRMSCRAFS